MDVSASRAKRDLTHLAPSKDQIDDKNERLVKETLGKNMQTNITTKKNKRLLRRSHHTMVSIYKGKQNFSEGCKIYTYKHYLFGGLTEKPF